MATFAPFPVDIDDDEGPLEAIRGVTVSSISANATRFAQIIGKKTSTKALRSNRERM